MTHLASILPLANLSHGAACDEPALAPLNHLQMVGRLIWLNGGDVPSPPPPGANLREEAFTRAMQQGWQLEERDCQLVQKAAKMKPQPPARRP